MAKLIKGVTVLLTLPVRLIFPRGTALRTKLPVKATQKIVCPSCLQGHMYHEPYSQDSEQDTGVWYCEKCTYIVADLSSDPKVAKQVIAKQAIGMTRTIDSRLVAKVVKKRVLATRILASLCWFLSMIALGLLLNGYFMAFFLAFFVIITNVFNMLIQGYRAWQLANNHFYSQTPKQDFIDFIKRGRWLSNPLTEQTTTKIDL